MISLTALLDPLLWFLCVCPDPSPKQTRMPKNDAAPPVVGNNKEKNQQSLVLQQIILLTSSAHYLAHLSSSYCIKKESVVVSEVSKKAIDDRTRASLPPYTDQRSASSANRTHTQCLV